MPKHNDPKEEKNFLSEFQKYVTDEGMKPIEKAINYIIDSSVDVGLKKTVKVVENFVDGTPLEQFDKLILSGAIKKSTNYIENKFVPKLKEALHEAMHLQTGLTNTVDEYGIVPRKKLNGDDSTTPQQFAALADPTFRAKLYEAMRNNAIPTSPIKIGLFPENESQIEKEGYIVKKFEALGLSNKAAKDATHKALENGETLKSINDKIDKAVNCTKQESVSEKQNKELLKNIGIGLDFLKDLGKQINCKPLQDIAVLGKSAIAIHNAFTSLTKFETIGAAFASGGILGPIGAIGGAIFAICELFASNGPSPTQIIINQLNGISKQLDSLQEIIGVCFHQNTQNHKTILLTMVSGFQNLSQQINTQVSGLHVEITYSMEQIQQTLNYLARSITSGFRELYIQSYERCHQDAINWITRSTQVDKAGFIKLTNDLVNSATHTACAPLLTGVRDYNDNPLIHIQNEMLRKALKNENEFNYYTGWLVQHARNTITDLKSDEICNSVLWYRALDKFIKLQMEYSQFSKNNEKFLSKLEQTGQATLNSIDRIYSHEEFVNSLFRQYYKVLESVRNRIFEFSQRYSNKYREKKNDAYVHDPIFDQTGMETLNFLTNNGPAEFIQQFEERGLNKIVDEIKHNFQTESQAALNKKPIHHALKSRNLLDKIFLAAVYLDLIEFKVQAGGLEGLSFRPEVKIYHNESSVGRGPRGERLFISDPELENRHVYENNDYPRKNLVKLKAHIVTEKAQGWRLPIEIAYRVKSASSDTTTLTNAVKVIYKGTWNELTPIAIGCHRSSENDERARQENCLIFSFNAGREVDDYKKHLTDFVIKTIWQNNTEISFHLEHSQRLYTEENKITVQNLIHAEFLKERKQICKHLLGESAGELQEYIEIFKKDLQELDNIVLLIKCYIKLFGKSIDNTRLARLVDSEKIENDLKNYNTTTDISVSLMPSSLTQELSAERIQHAAIRALSDCQKLPDLHPKRILTTGLFRITSYNIWRNYLEYKSPELLQYIDRVEYHNACVVADIKYFQEKTKQFFDTIIGRDFDRCEIMSENKHVTHTSKDYNKIYETIRQWAVRDSRKPIYVGTCEIDHMKTNNNKIKSLKVILENIHTRRILQSRFEKKDWQGNINLLMEFAIEYGDCKFNNSSELKGAVNFEMWKVGSTAFIQLLYSEYWQKLAIKAKQTKQQQYNSIREIYQSGKDLQHVLSVIGFSANLFTYLFNVYEELLIKIQTNYIDFKKGVSQHSIENESKEAFEIDCEQLLICGNIIETYVKMTFGYDYAHAFELITRQEIDYCFKSKETTSNKDQIHTKWNKCIEFSKGMRNLVLHKIDTAKDLILFNNVISEQAIKDNAIEIKGKLPLSVDKINIIKRILLLNPKIDSLHLSSMIIDRSCLKELINCLMQNPHVKNLSLAYVGLTPADFILLQPIMSQLTSLNVCGNQVGGDDLEDIYAVNSCLQLATNLRSLNLSGNQFSSSNIAALAAALEEIPHLMELDISHNEIGDEENIDDLIFILQQHPKLISLSLENTKLSSAHLLKLADKVTTLSNLTFIDLSKNSLGGSIESIWETCHFLQQLTSLQVLHLVDVGFDETAMSALASIIEHLVHLRILIQNTQSLGKDSTSSIEEDYSYDIAKLNPMIGNPQLDYFLSTVRNAKHTISQTLQLSAGSHSIFATSARSADYQKITAEKLTSAHYEKKQLSV